MILGFLLSTGLIFSTFVAQVKTQQGEDMTDEDFRLYVAAHDLGRMKIGELIKAHYGAALSAAGAAIIMGQTRKVIISVALANSIKEYLSDKIKEYEQRIRDQQSKAARKPSKQVAAADFERAIEEWSDRPWNLYYGTDEEIYVLEIEAGWRKPDNKVNNESPTPKKKEKHKEVEPCGMLLGQ